MVLASRKAVATQEKAVPRSNASAIVGRAVLVMLPSSADNRSGTQIAAKDVQKPAPRVHSSGGTRGLFGGVVGVPVCFSDPNDSFVVCVLCISSSGVPYRKGFDDIDGVHGGGRTGQGRVIIGAGFPVTGSLEDGSGVYLKGSS